MNRNFYESKLHNSNQTLNDIYTPLGASHCDIVNDEIAKGVNIKNGKLLALGSNVSLRPNVEIFVGRGISIGNGTDIGTRSRISCTNALTTS